MAFAVNSVNMVIVQEFRYTHTHTHTEMYVCIYMCVRGSKRPKLRLICGQEKRKINSHTFISICMYTCIWSLFRHVRELIQIGGDNNEWQIF